MRGEGHGLVERCARSQGVTMRWVGVTGGDEALEHMLYLAGGVRVGRGQGSAAQCQEEAARGSE